MNTASLTLGSGITPPIDASASVSDRTKHRGLPMEKLCRKHPNNEISSEESERRWFADLLWAAFPDAVSEEELADTVAKVLTTERRPVHPRTVRNWLRRENSPHFRYVLPIIAIVGAECVFNIIDKEAA